MEERYLTVTALTKYIDYKFDVDKNLKNLLLQGEISNFKRHSKGHFYFTLKDSGAQISAIMFASSAQSVKFEPKDGMQVFVKGTIKVYMVGGTYQIYVTEMKADGIGDLYLQFEALKKELHQVGLFNIEHKKPIPLIPKTVGVITSPTGAAIHDIINTISRRFPLCKIILYPALVQGEEAKNSIVAQINKANEDKLCDVIICGRGGGSLEDLWAFNEKIVAYAIYNSEIPIISAVGHEVDETIADYVADRRAATPTAAAEIVTPSIENLKENIIKYYNRIKNNISTIFENKKFQLLNAERRLESNKPIMEQYSYDIDNIVKRLNYAMSSVISNQKVRLDNLNKTLINNSPKEKIKHNRESINNNLNKLNMLITNILDNKKKEFTLNKEKLKALSPLSIMDKGYSIVYQDKKVLKSVKETKIGDKLSLKVKDGTINCEVKEINNGK